jgi:hypothetical protein
MIIKKTKNARPGLALLAVLFIVMAIMLISLGFLARSDRELACATNVPIRMRMDYLAQSGLNQAKALIINPQDVDTSAVGYWEGQTGLNSGLGLGNANDYFDIEVTQDTSNANNHCDYTITSNAYRLDGADKISNSIFEGNLRLDPCIALWTGGSLASLSQTTVHGDIFCGGSLSGNADINGDAFVAGAISATDILGDSNAAVAVEDRPISAPSIDMSDLNSTYIFEGASYSAVTLTSPLSPGTYNPNEFSNPAGIFYCAGSLELQGNVTINGTLIVSGNLTIDGTGNEITAEKNYPAMVVGKTTFQNNGQLIVDGLVQISDRLHIESSCSGAYFDVTGGVFIVQNAIDIDGGAGTSIILRFTAAPELVALSYEKADTTFNRWTSAGGGFFKKISRQGVIEVIIEGGF